MKEYIFNENTVRFLFKDVPRLYLEEKEQIVRCSDCKYVSTNDCVLKLNVPFNHDGFCSWGEAR